MKSVEDARNEFEEVYFGYLMKKIMQAEGAAWMEESRRLRGDPEYAVPDDLHERSEATISSELRKHKRRRRWKTTFRTITAACLTAVIALSIVSAVSIEARASLREFIIETRDKAIEITGGFFTFHEDSFGSYSVPELPQGFTMTEQEELGWKYSRSYTCGEQWIYYEIISDPSGLSMDVDAEDAMISGFRLNNCDATMVEKRGSITIIIADEAHGNIIIAGFRNMDADSALDIVSQFEYVG